MSGVITQEKAYNYPKEFYNTSAFEELIVREAERQGIDPFLALDIARAESALNPDAIGNAGEVGLFQIHPKYAAFITKTVTGKEIPLEQLKNPQLNMRVGIGYLKYLSEKLGENFSPALLAQSYNKGLGYTKKNNFQITEEMKKHDNDIYRKYANEPLGGGVDWEAAAKSNENVLNWWKQMPESRETDVVSFMRRAISKKGNVNYKKMLEKGIFPQPTEHLMPTGEPQYRWISDNQDFIIGGQNAQRR